MAYTTVQNLTTKDPKSGEIENGPGFFKPGHTFFYWEDVDLVLKQSPDAPVSNLKLVNIVFERDDDGLNHYRYEITGLALKKTDPELAALDGKFDNTAIGQSKWHDIVALAWPVYYKGGSTETLLDSDNPRSEFNGQRFRGSNDYNPGGPLNRT